MDDMQNSRLSSTFLKCGHAMHTKCYNTYLKANNIACPLCKKSLYDPSVLEKAYDDQIAAMPMPLEYRDTKMVVMCNDCHTKSKVKFHIVGGKCKKCKSYNTTRIDDDKNLADNFSDDSVEEVDEFDGEEEAK